MSRWIFIAAALALAVTLPAVRRKLRLPAPSFRRQAVTAIRAASPRRAGISRPQ